MNKRRYTPGQILTACICEGYDKYDQNFEEVQALLGISVEELKALINDKAQITKGQGVKLSERFKLRTSAWEYKIINY